MISRELCRREIRMTLIAAVPCQEGFVIAADSQETITQWDGTEWTEYRRTVQKIEPREMGNFSVVVAGAGNADLIESFIPQLAKKLEREPGDTLEDFIRATEELLASFYEKDVSLCPDKSLGMFVAAVPKKKVECGVWVQQNIRLVPVRKQELIGWEHALYANVSDRLCAITMTMPQAVLAAIYILTVAEQTSNYVRGPMSVAVVRDNGIWMEEADYVGTMTERLKLYDQQLNRIFLACADTSIHAYNLKKLLDEFSFSVLELHRHQIDENAQEMIYSPQTIDHPYPKIPPGSVVGIGLQGAVFEHDPEVLEKKLKRLAHIRTIVEAAPRFLRCTNCNAELEYMLANPGQSEEPGRLSCLECDAELISSAGKASRIRKLGGEWKDVPNSMPPSTSVTSGQGQ